MPRSYAAGVSSMQALATFMRFGYRKTSMEEVARAAGISRQGLYLHFATKEELFRAVVRYFLSTGLEAAHARMQGHAQSVEAKLVGAFDEWLGRFIGMMGADVKDLHEATDQLVGPMIAEHEEKFVESVTQGDPGRGTARCLQARGPQRPPACRHAVRDRAWAQARVLHAQRLQRADAHRGPRAMCDRRALSYGRRDTRDTRQPSDS